MSIGVKDDDFQGFLMFFTVVAMVTMKGLSLTTLVSKPHLYILGKSPKVSRENLLLFQRYLSKTTKDGENTPRPNMVKGLIKRER